MPVHANVATVRDRLAELHRKQGELESALAKQRADIISLHERIPLIEDEDELQRAKDKLKIVRNQAVETEGRIAHTTAEIRVSEIDLRMWLGEL